MTAASKLVWKTQSKHRTYATVGRWALIVDKRPEGYTWELHASMPRDLGEARLQWVAGSIRWIATRREARSEAVRALRALGVAVRESRS